MGEAESHDKDAPDPVLGSLFEAAASHDDLEFIYTLIRVSGESYNTPDPFLVLQSRLDALDMAANDEALLSQYRTLATCGAPLELVANLLRCARGEPYDMDPFLHLYGREFPHTKPTAAQMAEDIALTADKDGRPEFSELVRRAYRPELLAAVTPCGPVRSKADVRAALQACASFLSALFRLYSAERLKYREWPRFHKLPRFQVLELLVDDETGLYGVKAHFPNGESACLIRRPDSTRCGAEPGPPVHFAMAALKKPPDEWRVGTKRLYEIGLPGRYNKLGEWKPIEYPPGKADPLRKEAMSISEDPEVQGSFFYMLCTGHRVIEFVVRTTVELPTEHVMFGDKLHLWKCPPLDDSVKGLPSRYICDGWWELASASIDEIKSAIISIGAGVNMMAFAYEAVADWRLKYRAVESPPLCRRPSEDDHLLDTILKNADRTHDMGILHGALDWYTRGRSARNVFVEFLCYYIALESVATAVADGKADLGLRYAVEPADNRRAEVERCIRQAHDRLFADDPEQFVRIAYSDCVVGLTRKVRRVAEHVFGPGHKYLEALLQGPDSLTSIRGRLAHGNLALLDRDDEARVRRHVGDMARVSREFLLRAMLGLTHDAPTPRWSGTSTVGLPTSDPRCLAVISDESMLPSHDWRIRPEWCE